MRKVTEMQREQFSAKIYRDAEYNEYRVRFYHAGSLLPECDAYETDEESARGTAEMGLRMMVQDAMRDDEENDRIDDDVHVSSETEELNLRLAREFNWGESIGFDNGSQ